MCKKDLYMNKNMQEGESKPHWLSDYLYVLDRQCEEREQFYLIPMIWRAVLKILGIKN